MKMFIDDIRNPITNDWIVIRNSYDAIKFIEENGMVDFISFDHDLGGDDTSMIFVHWLIEKDLDEDIIKEMFGFAIHSANPVGAQNIHSLLSNYLKFKFGS